jgi:PAS domain S-box-containing protein
MIDVGQHPVAPPAILLETTETARAIAAAERPEEALSAALGALRRCLGARGAALLRADGDRLIPVVSDNLAVAEGSLDKTAHTGPEHGRCPLALGGRVEGVALFAGVSQQALSAQEAALAPLLALAALALREARLNEERAQVEAMTRHAAAIVNSSADAIIGTTIDGLVTMWNRGAERLFGYSAAEMIGRCICQIVPSERHDELRLFLDKLGAGQSVTDCETERVRKDGTRVPVSLSLSPVTDAAGSVAGIAAIVRDISARKRAEQGVLEINRRLRAALADLEVAQQQIVQQERLRALGTMASGIAHDFNNALAPVLGYSELLLHVPGSLDDKEKLRTYLHLIHTGAQDAVSVVRRLREFYRQRDDDEVLAPVDLHAVVEEAISLTQPRWKNQAQGSGRTIRVQTALQPVPLVLGNAAELREALTNLIFNAVDALPSGGDIFIATRESDGQVTLEVRDTGTGMTEQVRARCLEPFFTTKGEGGTGLGLSMVHGIVRRHNGSIEIESAIGKGTTCRIRLPVAAAQEQAAPAVVSAAPVRGLRVLLVDDEPQVRQVTCEYLASDGHTVVAAVDGYEAVEAFRAGRFDLVITDRAMPRMNGDQVAAAVKQLAPETPVILLTGFGDLLAAAGEKPAGVDAVVSKPVTLAGLRQLMSRLARPA